MPGSAYLPSVWWQGERFVAGSNFSGAPEQWPVAALLKVDYDRILVAFLTVVGFKSGPEAACLDADQGIQPRIVGRRTTENFHPDHVFFQALPTSGQRLFHQEAEKALELSGAQENT